MSSMDLFKVINQNKLIEYLLEFLYECMHVPVKFHKHFMEHDLSASKHYIHIYVCVCVCCLQAMTLRIV
jgi:hypothetical protein